MNRQQKELAITLLKKDFVASQAMFLVKIRGLSVAQMQDLRKLLRAKGGELRVAKARLMKRAVGETEGLDVLVPFCKDQIGLVFVSNEVSEIIKILHDFSKKQSALQLVVGHLNSQLLNNQDIVRIASLPSRAVLLAQVYGAMRTPVTGFCMVLRTPICKLSWILRQFIEKKKQEIAL